MTIQQQITYATISQYLSEIYIQKGTMFGSRVDPKLPTTLYMERKAVEYLYNLNSTNTNLPKMGNYLYSLCGQFGLVAQGITVGGGGNPPIVPTFSPAPIQFVVDASTSYIIEGETTKVISIYAGFNLLFVRNGIPQSTVDDGVNTYYSWDKPTGTLSLLKNGVPDGAVVSELFQLFPF